MEERADLILPHPELAHRAFVLLPLLELDPELLDPRDGLPLGRHLGAVLKAQQIRKWKGLESPAGA